MGDAAEFIALGAGTLQVCTAVMHYGLPHRRGPDRRNSRPGWMSRGIAPWPGVRGRALPRARKWEELDSQLHLLLTSIRQMHQVRLCWTACEDGAHQRSGAWRATMAAGGRVIEESMRWVQSLRSGLPGAGVHYDAARAE